MFYFGHWLQERDELDFARGGLDHTDLVTGDVFANGTDSCGDDFFEVLKIGFRWAFRKCRFLEKEKIKKTV